MVPSGRHESTVYAVARKRAWSEGVPPGPLIGGSWRRCVDDYGLEPARIGSDVLTRAELVSHRQQIGEVVDIARHEMLTLAGQIAGSDYALLFTNADGFILCHQTERCLERDFRAAGLWDGANWSEVHRGTNGIGTALVERRPVTVHCSDHFATRNTALSCSAAPIYAPSGHLLGVLDASSARCEESRASQMHTMALVRITAQMIEKRLFLRTWHGQRILRFHSRPEFVNLIQDGIIALDGDGVILAADRGAAIQLGFDDRAALAGREITTLFDATAGLWSGHGPPGAVCPVRESRRGRCYYACLHEPAKTRRLAVADDSRRCSRLDALAGEDPRMRDNVSRAVRVLDRNIQVMIHGETGTGKEAFARALHAASRRSDKPFVAINCAAVPETLIESELFGYAPGAFTGANSEGMRGMIAQSSGGTLFLDEIGDMPLALQTRLLRVLEQREVTPLGSVDSVAVDLNLLSATHASLPDLVAEGRFRADLYYRLNGLVLTLPPVRERGDVQMLLDSALAAENEERLAVEIDPAARDALLAYDWPGNIRQMRNVLRTALALRTGDRITVADLPVEITAAVRDTNGPSALVTPLAQAECEALRGVLEENSWNVSACARRLGISRNTLYRKLHRHGMQAEAHRVRPAR